MKHLLAAALLAFAAAASADPAASLRRFAAYEQGASIALVDEARRAMLEGSDQPAIRSAREAELLQFLASDARPQAKAIALEWLGIIGSPAALPALEKLRADPALADPAMAALARIAGPGAPPACASWPAPRAGRVGQRRPSR